MAQTPIIERSNVSLIDGLGPNVKLMMAGVAFDPIEVTPVQLITHE